ncbi:MAG: type II toxin-antitoxin system VapC family toxin [Clostridia bacterium]
MASSVVYWDTSALVAALFVEERSDEARRLTALSGVHLMSSLTWTELQAVFSRARREQQIAPPLVDTMQTAVSSGPWRYVRATPRQDVSASLARRWTLRGADLWHLALAKTLQTELPELAFATFDKALTEAGTAEGLHLP